MQGIISSVGNIDGGGQGGDDERLLKIVFDLSNITPVAYGESPNIRYSYSYTGYPSCYIVDSLGNEEAVSLSNVLHYYLIPVASNDEENTGVTCEFDGLMCEGVIRSATNNLQSATFYFMWYVDLNQDYLIIKNNITYHEPQAIPEPLLEKYINVLVDLTGITPTTEVVNGKTYNKFTFSQNKLEVTSYSNSGPLEIIDFSELIFYKTMPISNNNNDMGLYMSYDGTTFNGYVLSQETTLTEVSFMFDFYQVSQLTSFIWKNYVDMVFNNSSEGGGGGIKIYEQSSTFIVPQNVTKLSCTFIGGGGGGGGGYLVSSYNSYRTGGSGGGSGYQVIDHECIVTPGETLDVVVGAGGSGGNPSPRPSATPDSGGNGGVSGLYRNGSLVDTNSYASGGTGGGAGTSYPGAIGQGYHNGTAAERVAGDRWINSPGGTGGSGARSISYSCLSMDVGAGGDGGTGQYPETATEINYGSPGKNGVVIICWGGVKASDIGLS